MRHLLETISDESVGLLQLKNDFTYRKLSPRVRLEAVGYSLAVAQQIAEPFLNKFACDAFKIAQSLKLQVKKDNVLNTVGARYIFSEYYLNPPTIVLYLKSIELVERAILNFDLSSIFGICDAIHVFLAHEIFHSLEATSVGEVGRKFKVTTLKLGPLRVTSGISTLSDIAAYHFAKKVLECNFPPAMLSYLPLADNDARKLERILQSLADHG